MDSGQQMPAEILEKVLLRWKTEEGRCWVCGGFAGLLKELWEPSVTHGKVRSGAELGLEENLGGSTDRQGQTVASVMTR